ncbi:MAG: epimerase [Cypionkella sp.]|uniref:epimerase n=1 Tax=Cypionkella sp. TaxID=2811411 RepID=UPI002AB8981C|nr:epimerase [Cypionkella sp.]MDZ4312204.1 epimerase [Cypionkella sp.]MDZ4395876.1 epimerase [Cypionkella sp.]
MAVVLVAGTSGLFGSHAAKAFAAAGWEVRRYQRGTDMAQAAQGADVIVNAMNPPMYHDWQRLVPAITAQAIAAARASGATLIVPASVYNYGNQPRPWGPSTPQKPNTRKGAVRVQMEAEYRASGVPVILLRGGDFIDAAGKTQGMGMALRGLAKGKIMAFGGADVPRAYAYLPDMARAAVALAEVRSTLPRFADIPFAGLTFSMQELSDSFQQQSGQVFRISKFPWWLLGLAAPFWELAREMREMRYLYELPHRLDGATMQAVLPQFQTTGLAEVAAAQLRWAGLGRKVNPERAMA